ncbi:MAG TPA: 50S ribosomal protein L17 [Planctomycetota bacterium]|nr:50S ribosomal protein L17 [Planctomycetota bacterium]
MRHRLKGRKLGRTTAHRQALERNIVQSLFIYGRIITTEAKAKEFRGTAEHLITLGKVGDLPARRRILRTVQDPRLARKIIDDVAKRFVDRPGGYTRVVKLGGSRWDGDGRGQYAFNRLGDNGKKAIWELVVRKDRDEELRSAGRVKSAPTPATPAGGAAPAAEKKAPAKKEKKAKAEKAEPKKPAKK